MPPLKSRISDAGNLGSGLVNDAENLGPSSDLLPLFFLVVYQPPELRGGRQIEQVGVFFRPERRIDKRGDFD